jgi:hypothetical protein
MCPAMLNGWLSGWSFRTPFDRPGDFYSAKGMREAVELQALPLPPSAAGEAGTVFKNTWQWLEEMQRILP